ncbi:MAG: DUF1800 family protein [Thermoleophilaceae bacterium]|nr:DUF1800 family protein [Thermoleophilaceae bacterium]
MARPHGALGSFENLLLGVTRDPAMLMFLSGGDSTKWEPNENYARELMELFTLGAGRGYTEHDVREHARGLTGWDYDWQNGPGAGQLPLQPQVHDGGAKTIFGRRGRHDWQHSVRLCLSHQSHPSFFVTKLWSAFVAGAPPLATRRALQSLYVRSGYQVRPVVERILMHPRFYTGGRITKPPVVYVAGLLRALGRGIDTDAWGWIGDLCGQVLFRPPNVAGWDEERWLDTATFRGRWIAANYAIGERRALDPDGSYDLGEDAPTAVARALAFWGRPSLSPEIRRQLLARDAAARGDRPHPPLDARALGGVGALDLRCLAARSRGPWATEWPRPPRPRPRTRCWSPTTIRSPTSAAT